MSLPGFFNLIGLSHYTTNYTEKVISMVGGFLGIFCILLCSQWLLDPDVALMIVPSMGASAVLLFAAPHAPFSQPWNVIGGHGISAIVGGATALAAVIGSEKLHDLGYAYGYEPIKHEDFVYALSHIDTFVDITEEDLLKIYELATRRHVESSAAQ
jgi:CBS-domain-containing membrane protein